jgi:hypothetical protein
MMLGLALLPPGIWATWARAEMTEGGNEDLAGAMTSTRASPRSNPIAHWLQARKAAPKQHIG